MKGRNPSTKAGQDQFSKLIHTPDGLTLDSIRQIKAELQRSGVKAGWYKCISLALQSVDAKKGNHAPNVRKKLNELVDRYIHDPSLLRNKLAHGQWARSLNRDNSDVNEDLTREIDNLDVVELYRRRNAIASLSTLVEDLIKSPNKAHLRDYWCHICEFEDTAQKMDGWTLQRKIEQLVVKQDCYAGTNRSQQRS